MSDSCGRARIKRFGRDWYMPRRVDESERQRDQEMLSQMANISPEQMRRDLAAIKQQRKEEIAAMEKSEGENASASADASGAADVVSSRTVHVSSRTAERHQLAPARCKRNGRGYRMPKRSSEADRARDQAFLDTIDVGLSAKEVDVRFEKIMKQRNREIATGELEDSPEPGSRTAERHEVDRARCKRNGRDYHMPKRSSEADRARDQAFLDAIEVGLSEKEVDVRFEKIMMQRNREIGTGELEESPEPCSARKRRKRVVRKPPEEGTLQHFFRQGGHASIVAEVLS